jgi:hypothetical protein
VTLRLAGVAAATAACWLAFGTQAEFPADLIGSRRWTGDFLSYYLPNAEYLGARLAAGELPLWDPRHGAGGPFLASLQAGALYPPNALHALLPSQTAFAILAALHLGLAVFAAGALAAALGASVWGAALAGLAFATSLRVMGELWTPPPLYTSAFAPALFLCVERALARPGVRSALWLALCFALPLLAGWPYGVAIAALGSGAYGSLRLFGAALRARRLPLDALATLAGGVVLGAALAAPQLLPALELLAESCRALGSLAESQAIFVGAPHDPVHVARALLARGVNDAVPGVLALALAALAFLPGAARARVAALLGVGLLGLLASFPGHAPVYGWLRDLPVLGDFRFPYRYRLLPTLAVAVSAGVGLTRLQALCGDRRLMVSAVGVALLALQLASATRPVASALVPFARRAPEARRLAAELEALGAWPDPGRVLRAGWSGRLRGGDPLRVLNDLEPLSLARVAQLVTFFESGQPLRVSRTTGARAPEPAAGREAVPYYGRVGLPGSPERAPILDLLSVSLILSDDPPVWLATRGARIGRAGDSAVFRNPHALPRAFRVRAAQPEPAGLQLAVAKLVAPDFDPRRQALLDAVPPELLLARGAAPPDAEGQVEIAHESDERVVLRTHGERSGVVVLGDAWFPGWKARLDGDEVPLLRANLAFRAVAVPPGAHEIELVYRPRSLRRGLALAAFAALAGGVALASRGRSRPAP